MEKKFSTGLSVGVLELHVIVCKKMRSTRIDLPVVQFISYTVLNTKRIGLLKLEGQSCV